MTDKMKVIIVTGLSGAGKTNAADWFEDQGYYCVDNMPPALIDNFLELTAYSNRQIRQSAFVIDVRGGEFFGDLNRCLIELRAREDIECRLLFIEASDETLIKRYNETRRNHPLSDGSTTREVIEAEREKLAELRRQADYIIDTTNMKVAGFKLEMEKLFVGLEPESAFAVNVTSFGYKHGIPMETDLVLDMRFIPNPYYVPSLKKLTGNNKKVSQYVLRHEIAQNFVVQLRSMINTIAPCYVKEGKYHLNIAFGCTGGQHRSVAMANKMAEVFREDGYRVTLEHRDL
ncbi:RNase adapter RapZ [Ihubacter sp. mB4P-1]|uniref:RNase adapter RapZ n=1 Tax=Ihubacter sp. mB4P-1 TaxID=3242370 RepID=UPI003C7B9C21